MYRYASMHHNAWDKGSKTPSHHTGACGSGVRKFLLNDLKCCGSAAALLPVTVSWGARRCNAVFRISLAGFIAGDHGFTASFGLRILALPALQELHRGPIILQLNRLHLLRDTKRRGRLARVRGTQLRVTRATYFHAMLQLPVFLEQLNETRLQCFLALGQFFHKAHLQKATHTYASNASQAQTIRAMGGRKALRRLRTSNFANNGLIAVERLRSSRGDGSSVGEGRVSDFFCTPLPLRALREQALGQRDAETSEYTTTPRSEEGEKQGDKRPRRGG